MHLRGDRPQLRCAAREVVTKRQRAVDVRGGHCLSARNTAERQPCETVDVLGIRLGENHFQRTPNKAVDDDRKDGTRRGGLGAVAEEIDSCKGDALPHVLQLCRIGGVGDGASQHEALACRGSQQIGVFEHSHDFTARRQNRHVPQPALEHFHQHTVGGQIRRDGADGRAHHRLDGHIDRQPGCDDPGPQVAIGEDAQIPVPQPDQRIRHAVFGHADDDVADRVGRRDHQYLSADEFGDRSAVGRRCDRRPLGCPGPAGRCQEGQARRLGELCANQRPGQLDEGARACGTGFEVHARARQQRRVAEDPASGDDVYKGAVTTGSQCHRAVADHPHLVGHARRIVGDDGAGRELLDQRPGGELGELGLRRALERRVLGQELRKTPTVRLL